MANTPSSDLVARVDAIAVFRTEHGRWPLPADDAVPGMAKWLSNQRSQRAKGTLTARRANYLDERLPGWGQTVRPSRTWDERARALVEFQHTHNRKPTTRADNAEERGLAAWCTAVLYDARKSPETYPADRLSFLDTNLPGWRDAGLDGTEEGKQAVWDARWNANAAAVVAFYRTAGRYPSQTAKEQAERRLGVWIRDQRVAARGTSTHRSATREQLAYLDENLGDWCGDFGQRRWKEQLAQVIDLLDGDRDARTRYRATQTLRLVRAKIGDPAMAGKVADLDEAVPGWRDGQSQWQHFKSRVEQLRRFYARTGRYPRIESPQATTEEISLARWLRLQRTHLRDGLIDQQLADKLTAAAPGWDKPRDPKTPKWHANRAQLVAFCVSAGRFPKLRGSLPGERGAYTNYLGDRARSRPSAEKPLSDRQRAFLDSVLPGWTSIDHERIAETFPTPGWEAAAFARVAVQVASFVYMNERFPCRRGTVSKPERDLAAWLSARTGELNGGELAGWKANYLNRVAPGWSVEASGPSTAPAVAPVVAPVVPLGYAAEDREMVRVTEYEAFVRENNRQPRQSHNAGAAEARAGRYLGRWRTEARLGTINPAVRRRLDAINPGWENARPGRPAGVRNKKTTDRAA